MEEWSKQVFQAFEAVANQAEQWAGEWAESVTQQLEESANTMADWSEEIANQLDTHVAPEIEQWAEAAHHWLAPLEAAIAPGIERAADQLNTTINPLFERWATHLDDWAQQASIPVTQTLDPVVNQHAACIGCRHYHGHVYGGTMLVCAMYPYGPDQDRCPDWESTWIQPTSHDPGDF